MVKIKLNQIVDGNLIKAINGILDAAPPARVSYKLAKSLIKINDEIKAYDEQRQKNV